MLINEKIESILTSTANEYGLNIVQVSYLRQVLQILVEKNDLSPVGVDEIEKVSKAFSAILDVEDLIKDKYMLEVSSAGMDRPLVKLNDYNRFCGRDVKLELKMPRNTEDNRKRLKGKIAKVDGSKIFLETTLDGKLQTVDFEFDNVLKCKLLISDDFIKQLLKEDKNERKNKNV
ncbi:MAG: ribosome maturation factor RimP [Alphaproteobacteria bacterium]|nr:ribosome maturation factor RimP [Alphaproteobacteria bacterium]